jgi:hypothetical protein
MRLLVQLFETVMHETEAVKLSKVINKLAALSLFLLFRELLHVLCGRPCDGSEAQKKN